MKKIATMLCSLALLAGASGCRDLTELNQNPAATTTLDPNLLLPTVQYLEAFGMNNMVRTWIFPGGWTNVCTGYSGMVNSGGRGVFNAGYSTRMWDQGYPNTIKNVRAMLDLAPEGTNIHAAARIMDAEIFMKFTDAYGDIPYFDAGRTAQTGNLSPRYDRQEEIYDAFFRELKEAAGELSEEGGLLTGDLYFGGDIARWRRYANSLRLRAAMRLVKVAPERARAEAEAAVADGVMASVDDSAYVKYDNVRGDFVQGNGISNFFFQYSGDIRITEELIAALRGNEELHDPRFRKIAACYLESGASRVEFATDITDAVHEALGRYAGLPAQCAKTYSAACTHPDYSLPALTVTLNGSEVKLSQHQQRMCFSRAIMAADAPYVKMGYAEVLLWMAEAKVRGWNVGAKSAEELYLEGIRAACRQMAFFGAEAEIPESDIAAFAAAQRLTPGEEMELINTQLWLQFFLNPLESWANTRRTNGLPARYAQYYNYWPTVNATDGQMPRRLTYPTNEQTKNGVNYREAVDRMGGTDSWMNRVWWDAE